MGMGMASSRLPGCVCADGRRLSGAFACIFISSEQKEEGKKPAISESCQRDNRRVCVCPGPMNRLQRRNGGGTETPDHSHRPRVCEDGLCSARKKFLYLLSFFFLFFSLEGSNSPELNEPASDVPSAAVMRDFSRGGAKGSQVGACATRWRLAWTPFPAHADQACSSAEPGTPRAKRGREIFRCGREAARVQELQVQVDRRDAWGRAPAGSPAGNDERERVSAAPRR